MNRTLSALAISAVCLGSQFDFDLKAQESRAPDERERSAQDEENHQQNLYAPYEFLIGEWDVKSEGDGQASRGDACPLGPQPLVHMVFGRSCRRWP